MKTKTKTEPEIVEKSPSWYAARSAGRGQGLVIDEKTGANIAVTYEEKHAPLIARAVNSHDALVGACDRALTMMREDGEECCCHGTPDAIYDPGELCPMCDLKAALRAARA